jgi:predicted CXXCH cytochrome family protein
MKRLRAVNPTWLVVAVILLAAQAPIRGQENQGSSNHSKSSEAANQQGQPSGDYLGAETCRACHEEMYNGWEKSPHWKTTLDTKGGASHQGCEACHGPGGAHVAGGGDITKIFTFQNASVKQINDRCLTCHAGGNEHMNAINSLHSQNGVSCISCHSPHHAETKEYLLTKAQPELCYSCHLSKKAEFEMPFHHRVNEGLIQCSDCHNVHGTVGPKQVRTSARRKCSSTTMPTISCPCWLGCTRSVWRGYSALGYAVGDTIEDRSG